MLSPQDVLSGIEFGGSRDRPLTCEEVCALDRAIDGFIASIRKCPDLETAEPLLLKLGELQVIMATLAFKYGISLTTRQREIVREYDRFDLRFDRQIAFQKIGHSEFPWCVE